MFNTVTDNSPYNSKEIQNPIKTFPTDSSSGTWVTLAVPSLYCAECMASVERILNALPFVYEARVNLSLKHVITRIDSASNDQNLITYLRKNGYEAFKLNSHIIEEIKVDDVGKSLLIRVGVSGFAMMNVMLLSVAVWSGAEGVTRDLFHWISATIAVPAALFSAQPFFGRAWQALRMRRLNMDAPISLAIILALATSIWETTLSGQHAYFDAALTLIFFLLIGRYLDHLTRRKVRSAAQELAALEEPYIVCIDEGQEVRVNIKDVKLNDLILVRPGTRIPVDGKIVQGTSDVDRSILSGESTPEHISCGSLVYSGELNLTGKLIIQAIAVGRDTTLQKIIDLVTIAESARTNYTPIADRAARLYAPGVHILSLLSFLSWYLTTQDLRLALNIASAVLIITCPCALGLAVPAVMISASGKLFKRGLLVKNTTALERLAQIDAVYFDKTGTLTTELPKLTTLPTDDSRTLTIALGLADGSNHPFAKVLVENLTKKGLIGATISGLRELPGLGIEGRVNGIPVKLGRANWIGTKSKIQSATWLKIGEKEPMEFTFEESIRSGSQELVAKLRSRGFRIGILSGDNEGAVSKVAGELGITEFHYDLRPEEKSKFISEEQKKGRRILMIGDGLNDAIALTTAHVSISPGTALDITRIASDIIFLGKRIDALGYTLLVAKDAQKRIKQNLSFAVLYNIIAVPVAVIGLVTPLIAAIAMSISSVIVSMNAFRIR